MLIHIVKRCKRVVIKKNFYFLKNEIKIKAN